MHNTSQLQTESLKSWNVLLRRTGIMSKRKGEKGFSNHTGRKDYVDEGGSCESNMMAEEYDFDEKPAYKALAKFLCSAGVPPSTVEQDSFKAWVGILNPHFNVEYAIMKKNYFEVYEEERERIKDNLRSLDGQICLSMDLLDDYKKNDEMDDDWLDWHTVTNYLCVKAHFIDENWKLKRYVLGTTVALDGTDSLPENIILKYISEWEIEGKVSGLLSVTARMMGLDDSALLVRDHIQEKRKLQLDGRLFQLSCCADILCSIALVAFGKIKHIISKMRHLVFPYKSAPSWHLTLSLVQDALQLEADGEYLKDHYKDDDVPSPREWEKARGICKLVKFVYNAAEVLFETKHEGAATYLHNLQELQANLTNEANANSDEFVRVTAQKMLKKFGKYWDNMFLVLSLVTVIDPRYKMKYIEFSSSKYKTDSVSSVLESLCRLYDGYVTHDAGSEYLLSESDSHSESEDEIPEKIKERREKLSFGFNCLDEYNQFILRNTQSRPDKSELEYYLEESVLPWRKNFSVLSWWRAKSHKYPTLSKMARDLLAIQFSLVSDLEAYTTERREPHRNGLEPDMLNVLASTMSWLGME